jgi:hypothetical protein
MRIVDGRCAGYGGCDDSSQRPRRPDTRGPKGRVSRLSLLDDGGALRAPSVVLDLGPVDPLAWLREQGVVLQSARGPLPNLAEYVAGAGFGVHAARRGLDSFRDDAIMAPSARAHGRLAEFIGYHISGY